LRKPSNDCVSQQLNTEALDNCAQAVRIADENSQYVHGASSMSTKNPRHKLALDTARYEGMKAGNAAAHTTYKTCEEGVTDPTFRRVYVQKFVEIYSRVIYEK
jgi:hypothetical protein